MMNTPLVKSLSTVLIAIVLLIVGIIAFISTPAGKSVLVNQIARLISNSNQQVQIGKLTGSIFSNFQVEQISLSDQHGMWLEINSLEIDWAPIHLILSRETRLHNIEVEQIVVHRQPEVSQNTSTGTSFSLPFDILIGTLVVDEMELVKSGFGFAAKFSIDGRMIIQPPYFPVVTKLSVERLDAISGKLELSSTLKPEEEQLALSINLKEAEGGVVASMLGFKELPALNFSLYGDGTFGNWSGNLEFLADKQQVAKGSLQTGYEDGVIKLDTSIAGNLTDISPPQFEKLITGDFKFELSSRIEQGESIDLTKFLFISDYFESSGSGKFTTSGVPIFLTAKLDLDLPPADHFEIPSLDNIKLSDSILFFEYQSDDDEPIWKITGEVNDFELYENLFAKVGIEARGLVSFDPDSQQRQFPFEIVFDIGSPELAYFDLHELIGDAGILSAKGTVFSVDDFLIETGTLTGDTGTLDYSLHFSEGSLFIASNTELNDVNDLSEYLGQDLGGSGVISVVSTLDFMQQNYEVGIDAEIKNFSTGISVLDNLLVDSSKFSGQLSGSFASSELKVSEFTATSEFISFFSKGEIVADNILLQVSSALYDSSRLTPNLVGEIELTGIIDGNLLTPRFEGSITSQRLQGFGFHLDNIKVGSDIKLGTDGITANLQLIGDYQFNSIQGSTSVVIDHEGDFHFKEVSLISTGIKIEGSTKLGTNGLLDGVFNLEITNLSELSSFIPLDFTGEITSKIQLSSANTQQRIDINAIGEEINLLESEIPKFVLDVVVSDAWKELDFVAKLNVPISKVAGIELKQINGIAESTRDSIVFSIESSQEQSSFVTSGTLINFEGRYEIEINQANLTYESIVVPMTQPVRLIIQDGAVEIIDGRWDIAGGVVGVSGHSNSRITVQIYDLPLDIINNLVPNLELTGAVSGLIETSFNSITPITIWDIKMQKVALPIFQENSFDALDVKSTGRYFGSELEYEISMDNNQDVKIATTGTTGLSLDNLSVDVVGNLPLKLLDGIPGFAARSINFDGELNVNFQVDSSTSPPTYDGILLIENGSYKNPLVGLEISKFQLSAKTENNFLIFENISGQINDDGELNASGTIEMDPVRFFPADINIEIKQGRLIQEQLISLTFDAEKLSIRGPMRTNPEFNGEITVSSLEFKIPDRLPGEYSDFDVKHISASNEILRQAKIFRGEFEPRDMQVTPFNGTLDISVSVSNGGFFIRGRGIFAEMAGDLKLQGSTENPELSGIFTMKKGRLSLFGRNLIFERGIVTFAGGLIPELDFLSTYETPGVTIFVSVVGEASDPEFIFESIPELPQDEILALLLFGRQIDQLSTLQIATLAAQVAAFTNNIPTGWEFIGDSIGVDILDLETDEEGNTNFEIGKYINERIYLGLNKKGDTNSVAVDVDITKNLTGHGELDDLGESKVGIEFNYDF